MEHTFNTIKPQYIAQVRPEHLMPIGVDVVEGIRHETQFFNATPSFIRMSRRGARITMKLLRRFRDIFDDEDFHSLIINSYCHKLPAEGYYPSVPGWHCDFSKQEDEEERTSLEEDENVRHWIFLTGTDNPPTYMFLDKYNIHIDDFKLDERSWRAVSKVIDRKVKSGWGTKIAKTNELLEFRGNELYRHLPSSNRCWRLQIKITHYPKGHKYRPQGTTGKVRQLQMVYLDCDGRW